MREANPAGRFGRPFWVSVHRYLGLLTAPFLLMAGLTGSILAFAPQIDAWLNPQWFALPARSAALDFDTLAASIEAVEPGLQVDYITHDGQPQHAAMAFVSARSGQAGLPYDEVFVDPADGRWLGARARAACCLEAEHVIPFVWALHHRLMLPGVWGWWFMGGIALLWLFDTFVGTYLTLPRHRPFWQKWQVAWKIKPQAGGYRRHLDLHRAGGLWCWLLVFVLAFSSVYLNLREELFKPVVSVFSTLTQPPAGAGADTAVSRPVIGFEQARRLANEEAERQGWTARTSGVSHWREPGIYLALLWPSHSNRGLGLGEPMVYLDAYTGRVLQVTQPGKGSAGDVLVALQFPLHSGQIAGLTGRIVVALMGLLIAMLAVTGVVIWQRKRTARQPAGRGKSVKQVQRP